MAYPYRRLIKPRLGTPIYKGHRLSKGLVGHWLMNEDSDNKVFDLSGNRNTGAFEGNTAWTSGKYGSALEFDGTGDIVNCGNKSVLDNTEFTIVVGLNADVWSGASQYKGIISKAEVFDNHNWQFYSVGDTAGALVFSWEDAGSATQNVFSGDGVVPSLNEDHIVAVTFKTSDQRLYVDGILKSSGTNANGIGQTGDTVRIGVLRGNYTGLAGSFDGTIHFAMIYNRALSASEIALLYREPFCMFKDPAEIALLGGYQAVVGAAGIMTTNTGYWGPTY